MRIAIALCAACLSGVFPALADACAVYTPRSETPAFESGAGKAAASGAAIDTVLFDVGGVLSHNLVGAVQDRWAYHWPSLGLTRDKLKCDRALADQGLQRDAEYQKEALRRAGVPEDEIEKAVAWGQWQDVLDGIVRDKLVCDGDVVALAEALARDPKYRVGVLSNDSEEMGAARMHACGYAEAMGPGRIFISASIAPRMPVPSDYIKPRAGIYNYVLDALKLTGSPERAVFIDDREKNILPAVRLGMHAIRFGGEDPGPDGRYEPVENLRACLRWLNIEPPPVAARPRGYSLWLVPDGGPGARLRKEMASLGRENHAPEFEPHVTLLGLGAVPGTEAEAAAKAAALAKALRRFRVRLRGIGYEDKFFRSLYLKVEPSAELMAANRKAREIFDLAPDPSYDPHLSLLYGNLPLQAKRRMAGSLGGRLDGSFAASRVQLRVTTGMPQDWHLIGEFPLGP